LADEYLALTLAADGRPPIEAPRSESGEPGVAELALALVTIERPHVVQRLISSIRRQFPAMPIYVAAQSLDVGAMSSFYDHMGVTLVRMPYDAGVCASRNRLVERITEPFFVLCDDDFVFDGRTNFADALRILKRHPNIGVVGGRLYDYDGQSEGVRNWELFLHLDVANRTLTAIPIYQYAPIAREMGAVRFYICDAVMNFAVMRRSMFDDSRIRWDELFKSNGEHEDFFLNLKTKTSVQVAYLPTMLACHHHPTRFSLYRAQLRERVDGWKRFMTKWNIDQHLEVGLGVRTKTDLTATINGNDAAERFFLNDALNLNHQSETTDLLITRATELTATGVLDRGGSLKDVHASSARVLVRAGSNQALGAPTEGRPKPASTDSKGQSTPDAFREKYRLGAQAGRSLQRIGNVHFRYNPRVRAEADFVLWYRFLTVRPIATDGLGLIHLRWYTAKGRPILWSGDELGLNPTPVTYWTPLLVNVPVAPPDCGVLMFQIVAAEPSGHRPIACGFVSVGQRKTQRMAVTAPVLDVSPLHPIGASSIALPPVALDYIDTKQDSVMQTVQCESANGVAILCFPGSQSFDAILLSESCTSDSRSLLKGVVPSSFGIDVCEFPSRVAIPVVALTSMQAWGYHRISGFTRLGIPDGTHQPH
jgi:glycosyltransferase involved in cell wall biosynthesis